MGLIGLVLIVILAFIGPLLSDHDYAEQDVTRRNLPAKIPVLDKVPFLPFDGTGSDGTNAYKDAWSKENSGLVDQLQEERFMDTHMDWCSNFIVYRHSGCCVDIFIGVVYGAISGFLVVGLIISCNVF